MIYPDLPPRFVEIEGDELGAMARMTRRDLFGRSASESRQSPPEIEDELGKVEAERAVAWVAFARFPREQCVLQSPVQS